jgi:hypothetical protein
MNGLNRVQEIKASVGLNDIPVGTRTQSILCDLDGVVLAQENDS